MQKVFCEGCLGLRLGNKEQFIQYKNHYVYGNSEINMSVHGCVCVCMVNPTFYVSIHKDNNASFFWSSLGKWLINQLFITNTFLICRTENKEVLSSFLNPTIM